MKALLKKVVPAPVRAGLRRTQGKLNDIWRVVGWPIYEYTDVWFGRRNPIVPPVRLSRFVGDGDFCQIGNSFFTLFVELGGLQPTDRVLDVGCGIGRMAVPLTSYLTTGRYDGFDIVPSGIRWCTRHITPRYPNFRFHLADIYNSAYHTNGRHSAEEYRFPFADASFDFVFLISVLTHLEPPAMANYVREVTRVLSPGGRCFITYFLLNEDSKQQIQAGKSYVKFLPSDQEHMIINPKMPEEVVAHTETAVRALYQQCGLYLQEPIHYGFWCQREEGVSYQDIIVATKPNAAAVMPNRGVA